MGKKLESDKENASRGVTIMSEPEDEKNEKCAKGNKCWIEMDTHHAALVIAIFERIAP